MNQTKIEWVKNPDGTQGFTWNPITGCLNHNNGLCKGGGFPCYAYRLAHGRLKDRYLANKNYATSVDFRNGEFKPDIDANSDPFYPRFWPERLPETKEYTPKQIDRVRAKPMGIFVCDMGELFGDWVPREWQEQIFRVIILNPWHRFYLLTKQPQNLPQWSPFPDNCWVGVTVCNPRMLREATGYLGNIQAPLKYLSIEPLLTSLATPDKHEDTSEIDHNLSLNVIDWLIIGAQTQPTVYPKIEHVEEIVQAADRAGVKVFLKDNLDPLLGQNHKYKKWQGRDEEGHNLYGLRQEMPEWAGVAKGVLTSAKT